VGGPGNHRDTPERPRSCVTPAAIPARAHAASPQPRAAPTRFKTTRYAWLAAPAAWLLPEVDSPRGEQSNCVFPGQRPVLCGRYEPLPGVDPPRRSPSPARRPEPAVLPSRPSAGRRSGTPTSRGPPDCVNAQPMTRGCVRLGTMSGTNGERLPHGEARAAVSAAAGDGGLRCLRQLRRRRAQSDRPPGPGGTKTHDDTGLPIDHLRRGAAFPSTLLIQHPLRHSARGRTW
jgi:hypothetical protein